MVWLAISAILLARLIGGALRLNRRLAREGAASLESNDQLLDGDGAGRALVQSVSLAALSTDAIIAGTGV